MGGKVKVQQSNSSRALIYFSQSDLMLQIAVFSFCVLPDDHDVDVPVSSLDSREGLAVHHVGVQIQACAVEGEK